MARLNTKTTRVSTGPIITAPTATLRTHEGAKGYERNTPSELFMLGVSYFAGEGSFYEKTGDRDARFAALVRKAAAEHPQWLVNFTGWLRNTANIRTASIIAAAVGADEFIKRGTPESVEPLIAGALRRADEPGEFWAYWTGTLGHGKGSARPVRRALAKTMARLYTERNLLKYDTAGKGGYRFGDLIDLIHPNPAYVLEDSRRRTLVANQAALYKFALDRRRGSVEPPAELIMISEAHRINRLSTQAKRELLADPEILLNAGMNWEDIAGFGAMDKVAWEAAIPLMGYAALLRNLRNFEQAGISREMKERVAKRLADPDEVARSRQLPLRFLSAYRSVPSDFFRQPLDDALNASLANVPALDGRTLILVDRSGSMFARMSAKSEVTFADTAALFGTALALRAADATLVEFGTGSREVTIPPGAGLLSTISTKFGELGGTQTAQAVRNHYRKHDRVIILTDEQTWYAYGEPAAQVPANIPVHTFNLAGYKAAQDAAAPNRYQWGGLTDACFVLIDMVERGQSGRWPWQD